MIDGTGAHRIAEEGDGADLHSPSVSGDIGKQKRARPGACAWEALQVSRLEYYAQ